MKKILTAVSLIGTLTLGAQTNWAVDHSHSNVRFSVLHLGVAKTAGYFSEFDGTITSKSEDFSGADIAFTIKTGSINTDDENRDKHLKSDDFFSAEKFPEITFKSTSFTKIKGNNYKLKGNMTMKGVTKPVEFEVIYNGSVKDPWGNTKAGFQITGMINRGDFGIAWNKTLENGGLLLSETVEFSSDLELLKK